MSVVCFVGYAFVTVEVLMAVDFAVIEIGTDSIFTDSVKTSIQFAKRFISTVSVARYASSAFSTTLFSVVLSS